MSRHRLDGIAAHVVVVSAAALADPAENRTGPLATRLLDELGLATSSTVVADDTGQVQQAIIRALDEGCRLVLTCGGTGLRAEEVTVEATLPLLGRQIPGIGEELRRRGTAKTPLALLSRGVAGIVTRQDRSALVVNAPGSRGGVTDTVDVLAPLLGPLLGDLDGTPRS